MRAELDSLPVSFTNDELEHVFPFYFSINRDFVVCRVGRVLRRLLVTVGTRLSADGPFKLAFPMISHANFFDELAKAPVDLVVIELPEQMATLRGRFVPIGCGDELLFLGSPWVGDADTLKNLGLSADEVTFLHPMPDLLLAVDAQRTALVAAKKFADEVAEQQTVLRQRVLQLRAFQDTLLELSGAQLGDFQHALSVILRRDSEALNVGRVRYWAFRGESCSMECVGAYARTCCGKDESKSLKETDCPRYFNSVLGAQVISASDVLLDERTSELAQSLWIPCAVKSLLNVPVFVRGKLAGVLSHEHTGPSRDWSLEEQHFAVSVAHLLAQAMETNMRRAAEDALIESQRQYKCILDGALDAVITTDREGRIDGWNARAESVFGYSSEEVQGRSLARSLFDVEWADLIELEMLRYAHYGEWERLSQRTEMWALRQSQERFAADVAITPIRVGEGYIYSVFVQDVSQRRAAEEQLRHSAQHDALTSLPNRVVFSELLRHELAALKRGLSGPFAVLFIDLDGFKKVNDSLGHSAGDELLIAVAERLQSCLRGTDTAARFGGDEFTILLTEITGIQDVVLVAERIASSIHQPLSIQGTDVVVSASIGIVLAHASYQQGDQILRDADVAMYRAKERGKACYEIFDHAMHARFYERLQIENDLRRAIERQELELAYQPIVSLKTGQLVSFEALTRWMRKNKGWVSPVEFIPIAEETRLIHQLGMWVIERACKQMADWRTRLGLSEVSMSVNLSSVQFSENTLADDVARILEQCNLDAQFLKLEVTEGLLTENTEQVANLLRRLPGQKCIDDFGVAYSSLNRLHQLPFDIIKIDKSFIQNLEHSPEIVRAIIALAHNLGMKVTAEGVETPEQFAWLQAFDCDFAQGYLISRPLSATSVEGWLSKVHTSKVHLQFGDVWNAQEKSKMKRPYDIMTDVRHHAVPNISE